MTNENSTTNKELDHSNNDVKKKKIVKKNSDITNCTSPILSNKSKSKSISGNNSNSKNKSNKNRSSKSKSPNKNIVKENSFIEKVEKINLSKKKLRVKFKKNLIEIIPIESFKKYNYEMNFEENGIERSGKTKSCRCLIF